MTIAPVTREPVEFEEPTDDAGLLAAKADRVRFLVVPERRYFMIDGRGAPGSPNFRAAFTVLFPVAYTVHFALKRRGVAARIGVVEGLYWFGDADGPVDTTAWTQHDPVEWRWRLLLPVPEAATADEINGAFVEVARTKAPAALCDLRVEAWREGPAAQILHVGSYASEPATVARLSAEVAAVGLRPRGCHHEIYISDPNRTAADRLKTILRQPVEVW